VSRPTWLTAAGVGGAIVIAGSALVAVAATGPSSDPGTTSASPSATSSAEGTPESGASVTTSPSSTPESGQPAVTAAEAVQIARAELAAGGDVPAVEEIDLKLEDGRQIWDIEFVGDHEVEVDSTTGDVVKLEFGDGRDDDLGHDDGDNDDGDNDDSGHGRGGHDDAPNHD